MKRKKVSLKACNQKLKLRSDRQEKRKNGAVLQARGSTVTEMYGKTILKLEKGEDTALEAKRELKNKKEKQQHVRPTFLTSSENVMKVNTKQTNVKTCLSNFTSVTTTLYPQQIRGISYLSVKEQSKGIQNYLKLATQPQKPDKYILKNLNENSVKLDSSKLLLKGP